MPEPGKRSTDIMLPGVVMYSLLVISISVLVDMPSIFSHVSEDFCSHVTIQGVCISIRIHPGH